MIIRQQGQQASNIQYKVVEVVNLWHLDRMDAKGNTAGKERRQSCYLDTKFQRITAYGPSTCVVVLPVAKLRPHCQILSTFHPYAYFPFFVDFSLSRIANMNTLYDSRIPDS